MADIKLSNPRGSDRDHDCDRIHLDDYEMEEVLLPSGPSVRKVIRVVVRGRNLRAAAQPLLVFVGGEMLKFTRIAQDERSAEGILLSEPRAGAFIEAHLGDTDGTRHPRAVDPAGIKRLGP